MSPLLSPPSRPRRALRAGTAVLVAASCAAGAAACGGGNEAVVQALEGRTATVPAPVSVSTAPPAGAAAPAESAPAESAPASPAQRPATRPRTGERDGAAAAAPKPQAPPRWTVHVTRAAVLRASPGGRAIGRVRATTEFDSPTVLAVVRQRGPWLGVLTSALPNGRIGWISARGPLQAHRNAWRVDAFLHRHEVVVRRDGRVVERFPVAIGSSETPTPRGLFAVTDKLRTTSPASPYGCCILALTGHQRNTPQGWGGGDRIAIHATNLPETIGTEASAGCLRAPTATMRRLIATVPLGTLVRVHA